MLFLAINTATKNTEIALMQFSGKNPTAKNCKTIFEKSWLSNRDEVTKLLPEIENALKKNKLQFSDLDQLICITGPGAYTGLRIGITTANAISYSIKKTIIPITTWQYLAVKVPTRLKPKTAIIIKGSGNFHLVQAATPNKKPRIVTLDQLAKIAKTNHLIHDLNHFDFKELKSSSQTIKKAILDPKKLNTFAQALRTLLPTHKPSTKNIEPVYLQQPNITLSKKTTFNQ